MKNSHKQWISDNAFVLSNWCSCPQLFICGLGNTELVDSYILRLARDKSCFMKNRLLFYSMCICPPSDFMHYPYRERWRRHILFFFFKSVWVMLHFFFFFKSQHIFELKMQFGRPMSNRSNSRAREEKKECDTIMCSHYNTA